MAQIDAMERQFKKEKEALEFRLTEADVKLSQVTKELTETGNTHQMALEDHEKNMKKQRSALKAAQAQGALKEEEWVKVQKGLEDRIEKLNSRVRQLLDDLAAKAMSTSFF